MATKAFGGIKSCKNHKMIHTGSSFLCQTSSGGLVSPVVSSAAIRALAIPSTCAEVFVKSTEDIRIGVDNGFARGYVVIPKNQWHGFGVTNTDTIYYSRDTVDGSLSFYFVNV